MREFVDVRMLFFILSAKSHIAFLGFENATGTAMTSNHMLKISCSMQYQVLTEWMFILLCIKAILWGAFSYQALDLCSNTFCSYRKSLQVLCVLLPNSKEAKKFCISFQ